MGFAASLPWLAIPITVMTGGILSDYLVRNGFSKQISRSSLAISGLKPDTSLLNNIEE